MNPTITSLSVDISNDPISGLKRKLFHYDLMIHSNLEMTHRRLLVLYEKIDNGTPEGAYGRPILEVIEEDVTLTHEQKAIKREIFKSHIVTTSTIGMYVDQNGRVLYEHTIDEPVLDAYGNAVINEDGSPIIQQKVVRPEQIGIPELQFWQNIPITYIQPTPHYVGDAIYTLMKMSMKSQDNNSRI